MSLLMRFGKLETGTKMEKKRHNPSLQITDECV